MMSVEARYASSMGILTIALSISSAILVAKVKVLSPATGFDPAGVSVVPPMKT